MDLEDLLDRMATGYKPTDEELADSPALARVAEVFGPLIVGMAWVGALDQPLADELQMCLEEYAGDRPCANDRIAMDAA